jgi:hypothetical protein
MRTSGKLAPKTIYNIYADLKAVFRGAQMSDLIDATPCVLTKYQLGENLDKNPEWRPTAIYSRDELEKLISDEQVPFDRRVQYALVVEDAQRQLRRDPECRRQFADYGSIASGHQLSLPRFFSD